MKVKVKIKETLIKYVEADVDAMDEREIKAEIDYMFCEGKIDMNDFDEYEQEMEIVGEVEEDKEVEVEAHE